MKNVLKVAPLFVLALVLFGCGGGGSASPEGVGDSVLGALQDEDYAGIYSSFVPWQEAAMQQNKDHEVFQSEVTEDWWTNRKDRLASGGDESLDPGKLLEISDKEGYFELEPAQRAALKAGWYQKAHKWEKWGERLADMRLTGMDVSHGLEGDGRGSIEYENKWGDSLGVRITRIEGVWYATGVSFEGPEELPTKDGE